jgi:FkbM family methyltransferase
MQQSEVRSTQRQVPRTGMRIPRFIPGALRWRLVWLAQHLRVEYQNIRRPVAELGGIKIPVSRALSDNIRAAIFDGYYESAELRTVRTKLEPDDRVMEIGAGVGFISSYCAKKVGSDRVFAYEANPQMEMLIRDVYALNGVTPLLQMCIVSDREGEQTFYIDPDFWSSSTMRHGTRSSAVAVPTKKLNDEILRVDPTFLIMDIEGGEYDLFQQIAFNRIRKIAIELHTDILGQDKIDSIKKVMADAGFNIVETLSNRIENIKEVLFLERS